MSGLSFTCATGPVDNAWEFTVGGRNKGSPDRGKGHTVGGSSSGSAALLAVTCVRRWRARHGVGQPEDGDGDDGLGEGVDFALGGDQGGSIRLVSLLVLSSHVCVQIISDCSF